MPFKPLYSNLLLNQGTLTSNCYGIASDLSICVRKIKKLLEGEYHIIICIKI